MIEMKRRARRSSSVSGGQIPGAQGRRTYPIVLSIVGLLGILWVSGVLSAWFG
ncbi:hypothetical protein [Emcibacter sp. SYSU 3D8]|uniref:hypothetical protein n=1 Tax=Emcibacter sp. SYSU 3D8 TaxID=3133969 RepID=UPI0031FE7FBB